MIKKKFLQPFIIIYVIEIIHLQFVLLITPNLLKQSPDNFFYPVKENCTSGKHSLILKSPS